MEEMELIPKEAWSQNGLKNILFSINVTKDLDPDVEETGLVKSG